MHKILRKSGNNGQGSRHVHEFTPRWIAHNSFTGRTGCLDCSDRWSAHSLHRISSHNHKLCVKICACSDFDNLYFNIISRWSWVDESRVNYTNMGIQPFVNDYSGKNCVIVVTNSTQPGKWLRVNCNETHPFMCQTPRSIRTIKWARWKS